MEQSAIHALDKFTPLIKALRPITLPALSKFTLLIRALHLITLPVTHGADIPDMSKVINSVRVRGS